MWFSLGLVIAGLWFTGFGLALLFKSGFVEKLRKGIWEDDSGVFTESGGYKYDKYGRGLLYTVVGIMFLVVGILQFI